MKQKETLKRRALVCVILVSSCFHTWNKKWLLFSLLLMLELVAAVSLLNLNLSLPLYGFSASCGGHLFRYALRHACVANGADPFNRTRLALGWEERCSLLRYAVASALLWNLFAADTGLRELALYEANFEEVSPHSLPRGHYRWAFWATHGSCATMLSWSVIVSVMTSFVIVSVVTSFVVVSVVTSLVIVSVVCWTMVMFLMSVAFRSVLFACSTSHKD